MQVKNRMGPFEKSGQKNSPTDQSFEQYQAHPGTIGYQGQGDQQNGDKWQRGDIKPQYRSFKADGCNEQIDAQGRDRGADFQVG